MESYEDSALIIDKPRCRLQRRFAFRWLVG